MDVIVDTSTLLTIWAAIAVFSAISSGLAAQSKRMSVAGGVLIGAVFGPLGLLAIAAMSPSGEACRSCRELIDPKASLCPWCRTENPHG